MHREVGYTAGSFADAFGPAALRFFRPILVVGRGGGSYLGFSFFLMGRSVCYAENNALDVKFIPSSPSHLYCPHLGRRLLDQMVDFPDDTLNIASLQFANSFMVDWTYPTVCCSSIVRYFSFLLLLHIQIE